MRAARLARLSGTRAPLALLAALALLPAACGPRDVTPPPPRATTPAPVPEARSRVLVPIDISLDELQQLLEREVPQTLFAIDRDVQACVPAQRITICLKHARPCAGAECRDVPCKVGVKRRAITPALDCHVVGNARRGPIALSGRGRTLQLRLPMAAKVEAQNVGKLFSKTATASADIIGDVQLRMQRDWQPAASLAIRYRWREKPGTEFIGRRFTFAHQTDRALKPVIANLERDIPRQLQQLGLRRQLADAWAQAFTTIEVNHKPEVWIRITPERLGYGGHEVAGRTLRVLLQLDARVETFIGGQPAKPDAQPLPDMVPAAGTPGFYLVAPVIADYGTLVPVLQRALDRLAAKPVAVPAVGAVRASFGQPRIYATTGGRLAVGLPIRVRSTRFGLPLRGLVWLTAAPRNAANSAVLEVRDLKISGSSNRRAADLLLQVALSPDVVHAIEGALRQDFSPDIAQLRAKIEAAIRQQRVGDFQLTARLDDLQFGVVQALPQGAFLPVLLRGEAQLRHTARRKREAPPARR